MDCVNHPQQMEQPAHRYLICGYIGALAILVVDIAMFVFYDFFFVHMFWEPYYLLNVVGTWTVFFPISVLVAMGYRGLRIKYSESFLAASALVTAGYIPALWLTSFGLAVLPSWYETGELEFISFNGLLIAVGVLVIVGVLPMRKRCVRPDLLIAVVAFRLLAILLTTIQCFLLYIADYAPWVMMLLVVLGLIRDGIAVVGNIPLVLFFGAERHTASTK